MLHRLLPPGNRAPVRAIAGLDALDPLGKTLGKTARTIFKPRRLKEALSGSWLGHPLHPVLTDVTVGTFTSAVLLDWLGGERSRPATERLIALGLASTVPTVASGYSDWADTEVASDAVRRIGIVHSAANATASWLFAASLVARRRGGSGRALALAGGATLVGSGYLGGHMTFAEGVGVDQTTFEEAIDEWTAVLDDASLGEGEARCVEAGGTAVMVVRREGALYALSNRCSHRGGPLHEGELDGLNVH